ncbi:MAG: hypothetical protein AVDCRST_MAG55-84, partial [uncultured Rubrobacteraceae bacterium]
GSSRRRFRRWPWRRYWGFVSSVLETVAPLGPSRHQRHRRGEDGVGGRGRRRHGLGDARVRLGGAGRL